MTRDEIKHIADIAQIAFTEEELKGFEKNFKENMELVEKIKNIDTEGLDEVFQVNGTENNLRNDEIKKSMSKEEATANAASEKYGYFKLLKFVE